MRSEPILFASRGECPVSAWPVSLFNALGPSIDTSICNVNCVKKNVFVMEQRIFSEVLQTVYDNANDVQCI